jgi:REP element-mobilizing transposase RayT
MFSIDAAGTGINNVRLIKMARQQRFKFRTWGGRRKGAGRKPSGTSAGVPHRAREPIRRPLPLHVTLRMAKGVYNLRSRRSMRVIERALLIGANRFGVRVAQFSVQGNHMHLLVEASDPVSLARAIKGLAVRIAKGVNRLMDRRGRVFGDRFHSRALRTRAEVRNAVQYIRHNHRHHALLRGDRIPPSWIDPYGSDHPDWRGLLPAPELWLVQVSLLRAAPS